MLLLFNNSSKAHQKGSESTENDSIYPILSQKERYGPPETESFNQIKN
jgi:hypothetical protein